MTFTESIKWVALLLFLIAYLIQLLILMCEFISPGIHRITKAQANSLIIPFGWLYFMYQWYKGLK